MTRELTCCNDSYVRGTDGSWRYSWGESVPGAIDLTLADVFSIHLGPSDTVPLRTLSPEEVSWVRGEATTADDVLVRRPVSGRAPGVGDLVVGMLAPELHVLTMLTVADIGEVAGVSKATIDSYRYRGYLPRPQATRGRTPLWARPIIRHWLQNRPGCGWRTDLYGSALEPVGSPD